ncbi:MAG: acetyl-CoA carboxylase biotin carboxyl carrier protein subunit [Cryomorphaceae bacterium BACL21 MAG-121220-bin10]|jgi:acetyl-CoA carboxylase biotin carboxyl carrier protein|nr:MAG: acetyl-CoA carboxylase biotin carboxyl carrier protein subunit [Cryomorphaceae bacterium BACL21 MAG-121220-bin10]
MDIKDIQNLIKFVAKSGATEVKLEMEDIKITIKTGVDGDKSETAFVQPLNATAAPETVVMAPAAPAAVSQIAAEPENNYITVKSPIIGTFYRKPSPDKANFIEVGSAIKEGDVLCVIEAMKLFNEIESELSGTVVKILIDDSSPVEFDQPLFLIDPA